MPGTMPLSMLPTCIDPPLPRQQPVDGAEELEEQLLGREPLGQRMAVAAEGGGDEVPRLQRRADAHGRRLLALALVDRAGHRALQEQELHPFLELADQDHPPVEVQEKFSCVIRGWLLALQFRTIFAISLKKQDAAAVCHRLGLASINSVRQALRYRLSIACGWVLMWGRDRRLPIDCNGECRDRLSRRGLASRVECKSTEVRR